jgi:hypothetical protein
LTVGYGDICAVNTVERAYCVILMIVGGFLYSLTTGVFA